MLPQGHAEKESSYLPKAIGVVEKMYGRLPKTPLKKDGVMPIVTVKPKNATFADCGFSVSTQPPVWKACRIPNL